MMIEPQQSIDNLNIPIPAVEQERDLKLHQITSRVVGTMRAGLMKALAHQMDPTRYPLPNDPRSFEHIFARHLRSKRPEVQAIGVAKVKALLSAPASRQTRVFGGLNNLDLHVATPVAVQAISHLPTSLRLEASDLQRLVARARKEAPAEAEEAPAQPAGSKSLQPPDGQAFLVKRKYSRLAFRIHYVLCKELTFGGGADDILLGGVVIDPSGKAIEIPSFEVGRFPDKNQWAKVYNTPKPVITLNLNPKAQGPQLYQVAIHLAEKDNGGFSGELKELVDLGADAIEKYGSAELAKKMGMSWSEVLKVVMKVLVTEAVNALVAWYEDDLFPPLVREEYVSSDRLSSNGKATSNGLVQVTSAHGGKYEINSTWQLLP